MFGAVFAELMAETPKPPVEGRGNRSPEQAGDPDLPRAAAGSADEGGGGSDATVTASAQLEQNSLPMAVALAAFSPAWPGEYWTDETPPTAPPPAEISDTGIDRPPLPFLDYWEHRFTRGRVVDADGPAETEGWIRLAEVEPIDAPVIAAMTDAFPPAVFVRSSTPSPVPTIDLTIHFRAGVPASGLDPELWVLGRFRTRTIVEGFLEENGELWTADGALMAQSRQLAIMLPG